MESTTASTMEPAAAAESAEACMSHAGESVITPHLGLPAIANSAERAAIAARILALKSLTAETLFRLGPSVLLGTA
jgi:hypothetical protein